MSGTRRAGGINRFILIWILIFVCVALIWSVAMVFLSVALEEYESVQPRYAAEKIFEDYFAAADASQLVEYCDAVPTQFESKENEAAYLATILAGGELSYKEVFSPDSERSLYAVNAGDVTFASFSVKKGTQTTEMLGLTFPTLAEINVDIKPLYGTVVYAPLNAEVAVNGVKLDSSFIEGEPVVLDEAPYFMSDDPACRTFVNYTVSGLFNEVSSVKVTGTGEDGKEFNLVLEEGVYSAELDYLTSLAEKYNQKILEEQRQREEEQRRKEEEERLKREEEERRKAEAEAERQRISDSIKALYEPFVIQMAEQYNRFIYFRTTAASQNETKVYFKSGTDIYGYVTKGASGGYYNWSDFYVSQMNFNSEETSYYEWLNDEHTAFKCRISMVVHMYGKNTETAKWYYDDEPFEMTAYVDVSGVEPKVYKLVTTESDIEESQKTEQNPG